MILILIGIVLCGTELSVMAERKRITLTTNSLLLYFDNLASSGEGGNLTRFCEERSYAHTVYYRMMYFYFCGSKNSSSNEFLRFCDNLNAYYSDSNQIEDQIDSLAETIRETAKEYEILGRGLENDQLWEAHLTCTSVQDYYQQKKLLLHGDPHFHTEVWIQQPNYTEWFIHTIPFTLPVSCGFTKHAYYERSPHPAIADCLPPSGKAALYILFCVDSLIIIATLVTNTLILVVIPKTKIAQTPHG